MPVLNLRPLNIIVDKFFEMKITELIAQHLIEVHEGENWTEVNLKDTLADVDHREAVIVTTASHNTIAALVHHLSYYNDIVAQRLSGINPAIDKFNGFDVAAITNEDDWIKLREENVQSAHQLATKIRELPGEKMFDLTVTGLSTYYKTLHGLIEHAHYHLGQIVLLKKLARDTIFEPGEKSSL